MKYPRSLFDNESDVEQKLIWPELTTPAPEGFAYTSIDIKTKANIRRFKISKGSKQKLYYPDYVIVIAGFPLVVIEAKAPGEGVEDALYEARLYANELNALWEHGVNPCTRVLASDGVHIAWTRHDQQAPECKIDVESIDGSDIKYAELIAEFSRENLQREADVLRNRRRPVNTYRKPVSRVGGSAFQSEKLPQNTFGATIAGDYGHIFNPTSLEDRKLIAREAYIGSARRARYIEPIDRMIRNAIAPSTRKISALKDTATPSELIKPFEKTNRLIDQLLLLVGSVGAGKSTFIDYFSEVALPKEIKDQTIWLRMDLNVAPLHLSKAYEWIEQAMIDGLREIFSDIDTEDVDFLEKLYSRKLTAFKRGPLGRLDPKSSQYLEKLTDKLIELTDDLSVSARALVDYFSTAGNRLLVVVLDNCDKRKSDEQLVMFQIAQWIRSEFRCLTVLPIRDVTYDLYRNEPPLDTVLQQYIFRIEPPRFSDVLQARVRIALQQMAVDASTARSFSYDLPNGIRVNYAASDQSLYLASLMRSLYAHDRFVRQVLTGLAGRDVRRALEIFLDICKSGHIGEDSILKIRQSEGRHELPLEVVARVLLRMDSRFYSEKRSRLKNLIQCDPTDPLPDNFTRISLLRWFDQRKQQEGPVRVQGFHRASDAISALAEEGHDAARVRTEMEYFIQERCLLAEHLRTDQISDEDLIRISSSGVVHLQLLANPEYLAACAEDTYIADDRLTDYIASRIVSDHHSTRTTTAEIVEQLRAYLIEAESLRQRPREAFLDLPSEGVLAKSFVEIDAASDASFAEFSLEIFVGGLNFDTTAEQLRAHAESLGLVVANVTIPRGEKGRVNRGFAFLKLDSIAALKKAACTDFGFLGGRQLSYKFKLVSEQKQRSFIKKQRLEVSDTVVTVRVGNLPKDCTEQAVRSLLAENDFSANSISMHQDRSGRVRGVADIRFVNLDDALGAARALGGISLQGRNLTATLSK